jgi:hypothetical protein
MVNKERDRRLKIQMQKDTESDLFFLLKRDMQPEKVRVHFCVDIMVKIIKGKRVIDYNELYPFDIANSKG